MIELLVDGSFFPFFPHKGSSAMTPYQKRYLTPMIARMAEDMVIRNLSQIDGRRSMADTLLSDMRSAGAAARQWTKERVVWQEESVVSAVCTERGW